jgi:hypothetical protein
VEEVTRYRFLIQIITATAALVVAVTDFFIYYYVGYRATLSNILLEYSGSYRGLAVLVSFGVGVIIGHLFFPQIIRVHGGLHE